MKFYYRPSPEALLTGTPEQFRRIHTEHPPRDTPEETIADSVARCESERERFIKEIMEASFRLTSANESLLRSRIAAGMVAHITPSPLP